MFVLFIYHFWTRNRQILNFEHFELVLACFYSVKRAFSTKWWPGEENAPKITFFAFLVSFHINTTYIKLDWNSDNFLIFWCTLFNIYRSPASDFPARAQANKTGKLQRNYIHSDRSGKWSYFSHRELCGFIRN